MGEKLTGTGAVYVVQLYGLFTGNHSHVPRGHSQPTGDTMLLVVNAATGEITDMGITNEAAPLAQYGRVHALG